MDMKIFNDTPTIVHKYLKSCLNLVSIQFNVNYGMPFYANQESRLVNVHEPVGVSGALHDCSFH